MSGPDISRRGRNRLPWISLSLTWSVFSVNTPGPTDERRGSVAGCVSCRVWLDGSISAYFKRKETAIEPGIKPVMSNPSAAPSPTFSANHPPIQELAPIPAPTAATVAPAGPPTATKPTPATPAPITVPPVLITVPATRPAPLAKLAAWKRHNFS